MKEAGSPKIFYFDKSKADAFADQTEPSKYPHLYMEFVRKWDYDYDTKKLKEEIKRLQSQLDQEYFK